KQWQLRQTSLWVLHNPIQQGLEVGEHACHGLGLEEIGRVLKQTMQPLSALSHEEGQIKLARRALQGQSLDAQRTQRSLFSRDILQHKERLEERGAAQIPLWL